MRTPWWNAQRVPSAAQISIYLAVSLIWGSSWIPEQSLSNQAAPLAAGSLRFALAALIVIPIALPRLLRRLPELAADHEALVAGLIVDPFVLGITLLALPYALAVWAGQHGAGGWTPLVYAALPLLAATDGWRPAMIAAIGATLIVLNGSLPLSLLKAAWALPILLAVASQAFALHYARRRRPLLAGFAVQLLFAATVLGALSFAFEAAPRVSPVTGSGVLSLAILAAVATALAYWLYFQLLRDLTPAQAASTQWLQFVVTVTTSAVILGARPSWMMLAGLAALVACSARLLFAPVREDVTIRLTPRL
jgi:drug/metabolite transporter (DMT)-like permease